MQSTYSTWEFYCDVYGGALNSTDYYQNVVQAFGEINRRTFGNAETAPDTMKTKLKLCECELVDLLFSFNQSFAIIPKGIGSISNDGLSASVNSGSSKSGESRESSQNAEIRAVCQRYLLSPVNLMYAGVG